MCKKIVFLSLCVFLFLGVTEVFAQPETPPITTVPLTNPIGGSATNLTGTTDFRIILGKVVQQVLAVVGSITLVVFVIGGAYWLTSAGNADRVKKGTETMVWAGIGLFVIFGAYGILYTLIGGLTGQSPSAPPVTQSGGVVLTTSFYQVGSAPVQLVPTPAANQSGVGLPIAPTVACIRSTGKIENGYIELQHPQTTTQLGWAKAESVSLMTPQQVTQAGCQP